MQTAESAVFVVDTNVWRAAEPRSSFGDQCRRRALRFVQLLVDNKSSIAVDYGHLILGEYYTNISQQFDPYVILSELMARGKVLQKHIAIVDGVAMLPNEIERIVQDEDDRKFVAVSVAFLPMPPPPIVNATDSDWAMCEQGLSEHGVEVIQLCPELFSRSRGTVQDER